eukprot:CAMPEP_0119010628 /NCGR_PEP_ID=MMETSP1176-20130426/5144_1 /TAXON_ID=265551 /ORGANISM="Synedropsis recta cf, Strain CCMP1620" /LENGTH=729 /DNA_ID=CAMNT_0006963327 /DNA_START=57 /DNA_END=2246 /DNA_ORIENTATION=-
MSFFFGKNNNSHLDDADAAVTPDADAAVTPTGSDEDGGIVIVEANGTPRIPEEINLPTLVNQPTGGMPIASTPALSDSVIVPPGPELYTDAGSVQSNATTDSQLKRHLDSLYIQRDGLYDLLLSAEINGIVDARRLQRSIAALTLQVEALNDLNYPQGSTDNKRLKRAVNMFSLQISDLEDLLQEAVQSDGTVDQHRLKRTLDSMFLQVDDLSELNQQSIQMDNFRQSSLGSLSLCDIDALSQFETDIHSLGSPTKNASPICYTSTSLHFAQYPATHHSLDGMTPLQSHAASNQQHAALRRSTASLPANVSGVGTMHTHPSESFQAIGSFIAEKEDAQPQAAKEQDGVLTTGMALLGDIARFLFGVCTFLKNACGSLFSFTKMSLSFLVWGCCMGKVFCARIYGDSKAILRKTVADWASNEVVAFVAGMITMGVAISALWLVKYSTVSFINFAYLNATSAMNPILEKSKMIWTVAVEEEPIVLPSIPGQVHVLTQVLVHPDPIFDSQVSCISCNPLAAVIESMVASATYLSANHSSNLNDLPDIGIHGSSPWTYMGGLLQSQLHLVLALALAAITIYQNMTAKSNLTNTTKTPGSTEATFQTMSHKDLKTECIQRDITPLALGQDMVRHLCQHDGIDHSFPQRNLDQYAGLTKKELQVHLKEMGAPTSGNKEDLQYRLVLAREAVYGAMSNDDMSDVAKQHNVNVTTTSDHELARCLAEAGPALPLAAA